MTTEIFPRAPGLGYTVQPRYNVQIAQRGSGGETRNGRWASALRRFTFSAEHADPDIAEVLEFWHAHGGQELGFRFKDWTDYQSCRLGSSITTIDQPLVAIDATHYQLGKNYTAGAKSRSRKIVKPLGSSLLVANGSAVPQAATGKWSIDEETGILTKLGGFTGTPTTWGGAFYCYVRFETDPDFEMTFDTVQEVRFSLVEIPLEA